MDPFVGLVNKMMERMERCDAEVARQVGKREADVERREAEVRDRIRLEVEVAQLRAERDYLRVAPLTSVASFIVVTLVHR